MNPIISNILSILVVLLFACVLIVPGGCDDTPSDIGCDIEPYPDDPEAGTIESFPLHGTELQIEMVWIPRGCFLMGSPETDTDAEASEFPRHRVTVNHGFWMARTEMTQREYEAVTHENPSWFTGEDRPVDRISWHEARRVITLMNEVERDTLWRLPSEAEWEYAARAGVSTRFPWGNDWDYSTLDAYAWYSDNSAINGIRQTHPVAQKLPNPWGLYDMFGNLYEFCEDDVITTYHDAPSEARPVIFSPRSDSRISRGGMWEYAAHNCRPAARHWGSVNHKNQQNGMRLVRDQR